MQRRGFMALLPALPFVGRLVKEITAEDVTGGFTVPENPDVVTKHVEPFRYPFAPEGARYRWVTMQEAQDFFNETRSKILRRL